MRGNITGIGDRDEVAGHGVESGQHVEALASGRRLHEQTAHAPEHTQERAIDEMRGIYKVERPLATEGLIEAWVQTFF